MQVPGAAGSGCTECPRERSGAPLTAAPEGEGFSHRKPGAGGEGEHPPRQSEFNMMHFLIPRTSSKHLQKYAELDCLHVRWDVL